MADAKILMSQEKSLVSSQAASQSHTTQSQSQPRPRPDVEITRSYADAAGEQPFVAPAPVACAACPGLEARLTALECAMTGLTTMMNSFGSVLHQLNDAVVTLSQKLEVLGPLEAEDPALKRRKAMDVAGQSAMNVSGQVSQQRPQPMQPVQPMTHTGGAIASMSMQTIVRPALLNPPPSQRPPPTS